MAKDKKFCPISALSKEGQMICCNSKNVDCTVLSNHFLVTQIAGKPSPYKLPHDNVLEGINSTVLWDQDWQC